MEHYENGYSSAVRDVIRQYRLDNLKIVNRIEK